jgi:hypothetical protein
VITYCLSSFKGQKIKQIGVQKYVGRVEESGRTQRRHSSFYISLYGQTWVSFIDDCWGLLQDLMRFNRNKIQSLLPQSVLFLPCE